MSTEYHRPTHSFRNDAYNATQVRLYGIPGEEATTSYDFSTEKVKFRIAADEESDKQDPTVFHLMPLMTQMMGQVLLATAIKQSETVQISAGVIFGYAYEGHCYDLPKPKVMMIPAKPETIPVDDCGFNEKADYRVWVVDKLDHCAEIELNQGFIEQIVLDANTPGKRSPKSYSAVMQLAHRSGRLSE